MYMKFVDRVGDRRMSIDVVELILMFDWLGFIVSRC